MAKITGTNDGETFNDTPQNDEIYGLGDADFLFGFAGNDHLEADAGNNEIHGGDGNIF